MRIGKFDINVITQKLVTSTKLIKNKIGGKVFFEKYEPHKNKIVFSGIFSLNTASPSFIISNSVGTSMFSVLSNGQTKIGNSNNIGGYDVDGNGEFIIMSKKPNFFRRNMIRMFFGWKYVVINK